MFKTEKEIFSQYDALKMTYRCLMEKEEAIKELVKANNFKGLTYIGCGSSYSLCKSAEVSTKLRMGVQVNAIAAGDLLINFDQYRELIGNTILLAPSRSGSTSEVVLAVKLAREELGLKSISVCAKEQSELAGLADLSIELPWAFDDSVCQTRTVTNLYAANLMLIGIMEDDTALLEEIREAVNNGNAYMEKHMGMLKEISGAASWEKVVVLADAELEGIAEEGALAFNEICRLPSNYYHILDIRHGPMVLVNSKTLVLVACCPKGDSYQKDLVRDIKAKGALVVTVSSKDKEYWGSDYNASVPVYKNFGVTGIPFIFVPQALSYFKAMAGGVNPDEPQGLEPWIKL